MRNFKHYIALVLMSLCYLTSYAHDFEVDGIYYTISSMSNLEVEVSHWGTWSGFSGTNTTPYSGDISIPGTVSYNNKTYTVVGIGQSAFGTTNNGRGDGTHITSVSLPSTIRYIKKEAFYCCKELAHINLPSSLTSIGEIAFRLSGLKSITIPDNITQISDYTFWECENLENAVIGKNVQVIGEANFRYCKKLMEVYFLGEKRPTEVYSFYPPFKDCHPALKLYLVRDYISFENNTFTYTGNTQTTNWSNGLNHLSCSLDMPELAKDAGQYEVMCKANYSGSVEFVCDIPYKYTINKAPLAIKANNKSKTYGDENPVFDASFSGFVNNEGKGDLLKFELTTTATTSSDAGTYPILVSAEAKNYDITATNGTLTIGKSTLTATVNSSEKVYGEENPTFSVTYSGLKNNDTNPNPTQNVTFTTDANLLSDVGTYPVTVGGGEFKNYEITKYVPGTLTINKAPLTITCNDATKVYGDVNPTFSFTYTGLKNNDTEEKAFSLKPSVDTEVTRRTGVGEYEIIGSNAASKNYKLEYVKGTLTITKAPLSITANDATRVYGEANPVFTLKYEGFKNDETEEVLIETPTATSVGRIADVGEYNIVTDGAMATNYDISYGTGKLTITKAPLEVKINDVSRLYGDNNPEYSFVYTGFKNDDNALSISVQPTVATDATIESPVGTYTLSISDGSAKNYEFKKYMDGTLTINKASLKVIADNQQMIYGDVAPSLTYTCLGLKNMDTNTSAFSLVPVLSCLASSKSICGEYPIHIGDATSNNYDLSFEEGTMTVDKRELVAIVGNYTRSYNTENPLFEIKYSGFVNDDDKAVILTESTASCNATMTSDTGEYEILLYGGNAQNYSFVFVNGVLTIEKAEQSITWEDVFEDVKVGDQIELTAKASSGLEVEYTISDESLATIYTVGKNKLFLDCIGEGTLVVRAKQSGNNNYYSSPIISKTIKIESVDGIEDVSQINSTDNRDRIYSLSGQRLNTTSGKKGIVIINGKKTFVR